MSSHLLMTIVRETFLEKVGKFQCKKDVPQSFGMTFGLPRGETEEGYRNLEIRIFAPMNYVQVWIRETWDVCPHEDMDYNEEEDEMYVKPGKDYIKGATPWTLVADHDSGWTSGLQEVFSKYGHKLTTFSGGGGWFKVLDGEFKPELV